MGNIGPDLVSVASLLSRSHRITLPPSLSDFNSGMAQYPVFESAMTGRAGLEGTWDDTEIARPANMLEIANQSEDELDRMRNAVFQREGLLLSVFTMLRAVPRRVLMLFKMNDLLRYVTSWYDQPAQH